MPALLDLDARRALIAEAVWTLIRDQGLDAASVRNVAAATGLATGSVRHVFPTQAALQSFAMEMVINRVDQRVAAMDLPVDPVEAAVLALGQLLPLDAERSAENRVWFAFSAAALVDPRLGRIRARAYDDLRSACAHWVRRVLPADTSRRSADLETERLFALVDGLAVHAALRPDALLPDRLEVLLRWHLTGLGRSALAPVS